MLIHANECRHLAEKASFARRLHALAAAVSGLLLLSQIAAAADREPASPIQLSGLGQSLDSDLTLFCPASGAGKPKFQSRKTGRTFAIPDPQLEAVAEKACSPNPLAATQNVSLSVTNSSAATLYVAFPVGAIGSNSPGPISWGAPCTVSNNQAAIPAGQTCQANVPSTAGTSRFCAFTSLQNPPQANCFLAQNINQTMVETTFGDPSNNYCYHNSMASCVWYDISVIPSACTDAAWTANQCANTGGASYNLPVKLSCNNEPTYVCRGPKTSAYGSAMYPSNCGNPNASCVPPGTGALSPSCDNAYFHPTPVPSPNAQCLAGETLNINFLPGP
jgi:hypothetical protein